MKRRLFAGLLVLLTLGFVALGVWQLERRTWKLRLIDQVQARIHAPARPLESLGRVGAADAYTRVIVRGVLLPERQAFVQAVTEQGPGWWVMTPLRTDRGIVMINRGFVPPEHRDPLMCGGAKGEVTITGLLRTSEPGGGFLRRNDPGADRWYSRDVQAIGQARRLGSLPPYFIDADTTPNPGGYPVGGLTVVAFRNTHLIYALTWFGLAGLCVFGIVLLARPQETA